MSTRSTDLECSHQFAVAVAIPDNVCRILHLLSYFVPRFIYWLNEAAAEPMLPAFYDAWVGDI